MFRTLLMNECRRALIATLLLCSAAFLIPDDSLAQLRYRNTPAIELFSELRKETSYRFLYREAQVSDIRISMDTSPDSLVADLSEALKPYGLQVTPDFSGKRLLIYKDETSKNDTDDLLTLEGQIVNAYTGERLPFGTIRWDSGANLSGTAANEAGRFRFRIKPGAKPVRLRASYVGFEDAEILVDPETLSDQAEITFRLEPSSFTGSEVVVVGKRYLSAKDSLLSGLVRSDRFSPLGDGNAVRALQVLPSVGITTIMNEGLNVRGSTPDGFQLELDGITIFNQSHLFGLIDSFNDDAILNTGFYYNITPAHVNAPVGGKLSLITRNGSLNQTSGKGGISSTSVRLTLDGPVRKGKSSWLISGRSSYINQMNWFNNERLIRWGLNIERPSSLRGPDTPGSFNIVDPLGSDVFYFDLHGKFYHESEKGNRSIASFYFGGDRTFQAARRFQSSISPDLEFTSKIADTRNRWNNFAFSLQHQRNLSGSLFSKSTLGFSAYETLFEKGDFLYVNRTRIGGSLETSVFRFPLSNESNMNRAVLRQLFHYNPGQFDLKAGFEGNYHRGEYLENSFERQGFFTRVSSYQADLFVQTEFSPVSNVDFSTGLRSHYYSDGSYFRLSPQFELRLFDQKSLSLRAGVSRNHQFVNRVSFKNAVTSDIWILSNQEQPPSEVTQATAGIYLQAFNGFYFQAETYLKDFSNLRLHEFSTRTLSSTFNRSPWFFRNDGTGKGVEFLARKNFAWFDISVSYTLSSITLQNSQLNEGERFYASWDRTHSSSTYLEVPFLNDFDLSLSWIMASGNMDYSDSSIAANRNRLPAYYRLDSSVRYQKIFGDYSLSAKFTISNLLDRNNVWYREFQPVVIERSNVPAIRTRLVNVYDLGIQPSFEIKVGF